MFGFGKKIHYVNFPKLDMRRSTSIEGESYNQANLAEAARWKLAADEHLWVALRAEPSNPYDSKAIRVDRVKPDGSGALKVGYIARTDTGNWHPVVASAPRGTAWVWPAALMGGTDGKSIGIHFKG